MMPGYINVKIKTSSDDSDEENFDEFEYSYWLHHIGPWKHKHKIKHKRNNFSWISPWNIKKSKT